ncbi:hypothetical protein HDU67_009847 [Dinochytrium kinnereticum]|nr:hypothetical protein HDU67_009847 [Dinochytrium kinnereticum]
MEEVISEAIVKAKESGLELGKTYIADAFVQKNGAVLSQELQKRYLRGRGRYGATPHAKTALVELTLQERERPFPKREGDPLEWIRRRLRLRLGEVVEGPEEVYEGVRRRRVVKTVHC